MNEATFNNPGDRTISNSAPDNFKLDEIEWDKTEHAIQSGAIPFKKTTKKILKELEHG